MNFHFGVFFIVGSNPIKFQLFKQSYIAFTNGLGVVSILQISYFVTSHF